MTKKKILIGNCISEFEEGTKEGGIEEGLRRFFKSFGVLLGECFIDMLQLNRHIINLILD